MNKYWYVVQNEENKEQNEYLIGFLYGRSDATEEELIECTKTYCREKEYRLALLIQMPFRMPLINQIYPYEQTEETMMCLEYALQTIM
ncbi:hypothetical protein [Clostridium sp. Marseille-P2415]|uniref:hypothetical protein n=1 Tax=Clostridium sp. Marseille-P2415 TaxID=1805471 RepID=UPI0009888BE2|nr:hypothetical protein [Clostridium sp. Marseille-P2415]